MSSPQDNFSFEELKNKYDYLKNINFTKIYEEFNDETKFVVEGKQYCNEIKKKLSIPHSYEDISDEICNNLYKITVNFNNLSNDHFDGIPRDDKMYCHFLKYWLYEKLGNSQIMGLNTKMYFQNVKEEIEAKIPNILPFSCTFNKMENEDVNRLRKIYAFLLIYYRNIENFHNEKHILCNYLNYFGKGLKAYYESIRECSNKQNDNNYCKELNELEEIYNLDKLYWKHSTLNTGYIYSEDTTSNCPLNIESLKDPLRLTYKEEKYTLNISNEPIDSRNSSIISASSAMGATVGISAFLLYLFKYTSLGLLFRSQKQKDNIILNNVDGDAYDFTFANSEYKHENIENTDYNISYLSLNNS
ncbi:PIR Superfamily Protein [Plasmodium ovale curtisi]|uniref:PIR Superfamily Protein n=1 Tax=Plasmodium ovale curtisi TaxID=864141 RepID=A0A1A8WKE6_PLAOA|nr:PIR Superfamily Protein [Plasmodium ovale curtisi]